MKAKPKQKPKTKTARQWTDTDDVAAEAQGWRLSSYEDLRPNFKIERIDTAPTFNSDSAALAHVLYYAQLGEATCIKAIRCALKL